MNSKKPGTPKAKKKENRSGNKGNILWKYYKELGETSLSEFKALLQENGIPLTTFYADTYLDKNLGSIPVGRIYVYKAYFKNLDLESLIEVKKPENLQSLFPVSRSVYPDQLIIINSGLRMEPKYFYSESKCEAVCLRHPYHIENIIMSTGDASVIKIAHYHDAFMYNLLEETWANFECARQTYEDFKKGVLEAMNLMVNQPSSHSFPHDN